MFTGDDTMEAAVDDAAAAVLDSADGTFTVSVVPGFYYTLESGASVSLGTLDTQLATTSDEALVFEADKSGTAGFYRISVSATNPTKSAE